MKKKTPKSKKVAKPAKPLTKEEARDIIIEKTARAWLKYAERELGEDVYPALLSTCPQQWVESAYNDIEHNVFVAAGDLGPTVISAIGQRAIKRVIEILYKEPLVYMRTLNYMLKRSFNGK